MSFFDQLDRRHRQSEPIRPERMAVGQESPDPKCRGRMMQTLSSVPLARGRIQARLACDNCGWAQEPRT